MLCSHLIYKKGFLLHHPLLLNLWWLWSISVLKGQKWNSDILTKQSKPSLAKSSSKLFFVGRLRGKKCKSGGSSKVLQDTSNTLDTSQPPAQGPQKVRRPGAFIWRSLREHSCIQDQTTFAVLFLFFFFQVVCFCFPATQPRHARRRRFLWPAEPIPEQPHGWPAMFDTGPRQQVIAKQRPRVTSQDHQEM